MSKIGESAPDTQDLSRLKAGSQMVLLVGAGTGGVISCTWDNEASRLIWDQLYSTQAAAPSPEYRSYVGLLEKALRSSPGRNEAFTSWQSALSEPLAQESDAVSADSISTQDWEDIKSAVLDILASGLDTPEAHVDYIKRAISGVAKDGLGA